MCRPPLLFLCSLAITPFFMKNYNYAGDNFAEQLAGAPLIDHLHSTCNKEHGIFAVYKQSAGLLCQSESKRLELAQPQTYFCIISPPLIPVIGYFILCLITSSQADLENEHKMAEEEVEFFGIIRDRNVSREKPLLPF